MHTLRRALGLTLALALVGCSDDVRDVALPVEFETRMLGADAPPPGAIVTDRLEYERLPDARELHDDAAAGARAALDPALLAGLRPAPLVRLAHVSDVQLREERAQLFVFDELAE